MTAFPKPKDQKQTRKRRNHSRRNKTRERRKMILELDRVTRFAVFMRDANKCLRCGSEKNLQWAHVLSRRHIALRHEMDNGMTLCAGCHLKWHHEPLLAVDWFRKAFPERYDRLKSALQLHVAVDVRALWQERVGKEKS